MEQKSKSLKNLLFFIGLIFNPLVNAVSFLTIFACNNKNRPFPVGGQSAEAALIKRTKDLQASIKFFPLAGLFIGAVLASVFYIFNLFLAMPASILLSLLFLFILTGGLHFDGLSDTADGLFAYLKSRDKSRFYKAMKDVNTGFAGNAAILFYALIMWVLIGGINLKFAYLSLLTFPVMGRYSIVLISYFLSTPDDFKGIGAVFTEGTNLVTLIAASILTAVIIYLFLNLAGIFSLLISVLFILILGLYFSKKFGGVNGDMLGFGLKVSEVVYVTALSGFYKVLVRI